MTNESLNISNNNEITLKEVILKIRVWYQYLISKWLIILGITVLSSIIGFYYAQFKKTIYTATTTFVLEDDKSGGGGLGNLGGLASMAGIDLGGAGGGIFQGDNLLELYKSRSMIEKTLLSRVNDQSRELIIDRYIASNKLREQWSKKKQLSKLSFSEDDLSSVGKSNRLKDSVLGDIVKDINKNYLSVAKPDKKLSIIKVNVRATDEVFAKMFNDQIVKNVNDFYAQTKTKKSQDNIAILQHKTDSVRNVMNGAIYTAAAATDATPNLNPTRQAQRVAPVQRSQFSAETNKAILSTLLQNLELSKMTLLKETPLIQVVDEPVFPLEAERIGKLKGIILGGIIGGFIACLFLTVTRFFKKHLA